ncbi:ion channel [Bacillus songklensis]|uniref:Ion channel n=1 Tax=Bacillus songklensis TaxID=1069116 RepID=A0ABV8BC82_9BACI
MPEHFLFRFFRHSILFRLAVLSIFFITTFGITIHLLEPKKFASWFEGIWWAVVTISTVGYGDSVPETAAGKVVGMILILFGTGFISTYFITLSSIAVAKENAYLDGSLAYTGKKHIILVGWNERVKSILTQYIEAQLGIHLVLIDESLSKKPMVTPYLHFIRGNPTHSHTLQRANIQEASKVMITADPSKTEELADMQTVLTLIAVKGMNPSAYSIVEILTPTQELNARHAGANEIIRTNHLAGQVMYQHLFDTDFQD